MARKTPSYFERASALVAQNCHSQGFVVGEFVVWYRKEPTFDEDDLPLTKTDLLRKYVRLARVRAVNLDEVYEFMQGEQWSPNGEANEIIKGLGLTHTSMSVGDIIQSLYMGKFWAVMDIGYKELKLQ